MEKSNYQVLQLKSGQIFIVRGGWDSSKELDIKKVYVLEAIPSSRGVTMGLSRLDAAPLMAESIGTMNLKDSAVDITYWLKADSSILKKLEDVDKAADAKNAGIVLPPDVNNPGIVR